MHVTRGKSATRALMRSGEVEKEYHTLHKCGQKWPKGNDALPPRTDVQEYFSAAHILISTITAIWSPPDPERAICPCTGIKNNCLHPCTITKPTQETEFTKYKRKASRDIAENDITEEEAAILEDTSKEELSLIHI